MAKSGFIINAETFLWTERGLLKASEIRKEDLVLGLDRVGRPSWATLTSSAMRSRLRRIITDCNDIMLGGSCGVFTVRGLKKASRVTEEDIIETANLPSGVHKKWDELPLPKIDTKYGTIIIDEKLAYLLGTQVNIPYHNRMVFTDLNREGNRDMARLFSDTLREHGIWRKLLYSRWGTRVRFESRTFEKLSSHVWKNNIPLFIRQSSPYILRQFLCGLLDMIIRIDEYEKPLLYFITPIHNSHLRRFVFNSLRLFNIIPVKTYVFHPKNNLPYAKTFVRYCDLKDLGLRFYKICEPVSKVDINLRPSGYSQVRDLSLFFSKASLLQTAKLHWSLIADLVPIYPSRSYAE